MAWREERFSDKGAGGGKFKTPTLREIARTAPYMHDGSLTALEDVVAFYDSGAPLHLTADEKHALVAFLGSLSRR